MEQRANDKRLGIFVADAILSGGSLHTSCSVAQVLGFALEYSGRRGATTLSRSNDAVVLGLRPNLVTLPNAALSSQSIGTSSDRDALTVRASPVKGRTLVEFVVESVDAEGMLNLSAAGAVGWVMAKIHATDPSWTATAIT